MESSILNDTADTNEDLRQHPLPIWTSCVLISLSFLGVIGNSIVCYIIGRTKKLHSPTNYLIANLAVADLLVCLSSTVKPIIDNLTNSSWPSTNISRILFCQFLESNVAVFVSSTASALALTIVSFERFIGIVYPLHYPRLVTNSRLKIAILCQWIISISAAMPFRFKIFYDDEAHRCQSSVSVPIVLLYAFAGYVLPITALVYLYSRMFISLRRTRGSVKGKRSNPKVIRSFRQPQASLDGLQRARKNILINLFIITVLFVLFTTPSIAQVIVVVIEIEGDQTKVSMSVYRVTAITLLANSVVNPFVYAFRYQKFQKAIRVTLNCKT